MVVDEIHHIPRLLRPIQAILAEPSPPRIVLTASSSRISSRRSDIAPGLRLPQHAFHPLMAAELPAFDLTRALQFGMLPQAVIGTDPQKVIECYAQACIADVMGRGLTRHIGRFRRFLQAVSLSHGRPLNIASVARRCAVERKIVAGYIAILEDLMVAFRVPVYKKRTIAGRPSDSTGKRVTISRDKLFLLDPGFQRALLPPQPPERHAELERRAVAGLVAQHILAWSSYSRFDAELCYWRTRAGTEVDLVVHGTNGLQAFKIKNAETVASRDFRALRAFRHDHPEVEAAVLYRGARTTQIDGIWCLPVDGFLKRMQPDHGLLEWL